MARAADWFNPDRGLLFEPMTFNLRANSLGEAVRLGGRGTRDALTLVYRTVGAISTNKVSIRLIAGPWTILRSPCKKPTRAPPSCCCSSPLQRQPGGNQFSPHSALGRRPLRAPGCYEGIRGKPAPESVQIVLSYIGLTPVLWG